MDNSGGDGTDKIIIRAVSQARQVIRTTGPFFKITNMREITIEDEIMDEFRSKFPLTAYNVYNDGKIMNYRIKNAVNVEAWEKLAKSIIRQLELPLEASIEKWERGGVVFEVNLQIEFKQV